MTILHPKLKFDDYNSSKIVGMQVLTNVGGDTPRATVQGMAST